VFTVIFVASHKLEAPLRDCLESDTRDFVFNPSFGSPFSNII